MKTKKMSLANVQGKLSRVEMKNIMAGSEGGGCPGILSCKREDEGSACPDVSTSTGCTCREDPQDGYMCLP